jgi:hypothetical protein
LACVVSYLTTNKKNTIKTTRKLIALIVSVTTLTVHAQDTLHTKPIKRVSMHDFYVQAGLFGQRSPSGSVVDFRTLFPQSVLLSNTTGYSQPNGFSVTGTSMLSVQLGLQFSNKQKQAYKSNPVLRLGVVYFSQVNLTGSLNKDLRKTYDTLTSIQTGQTVYRDSVITQNLGMSLQSQQLRFDASLIFRTNPLARFMLFTGIGLTAGVSFQTSTHIYYSTNSRTETRDQNGNTSLASSSYDYGHFTHEQVNSKNGFGISAYVPMGVDFRIGKRSNFWKPIHLFFELRPGINITSIPELRNITSAYMQTGLGVRVVFK